jgi:integrase
MPAQDDPKKGKPKKSKKQERGARGGGAVFFSETHDRWIWRAIVGHKPDGGLTYKEGRCRTQTEAVKKKQEAEKGNQQPHENKETVGQHLEHWLHDVAEHNTRPGTWKRYEVVVRVHLKPRIGGVPLRKLTVSQVTRLWATMIREDMSAGNVKKCSEVLATALECAVAEQKIPVAPTANAAKPKVERGEVEVFTDDEVKRILAAARGDRFEALYAVAA